MIKNIKIKTNFFKQTLFSNLKFCYQKSTKQISFFFIFSSVQYKQTVKDDYRRNKDGQVIRYDESQHIFDQFIYDYYTADHFSSSIFWNEKNNSAFRTSWIKELQNKHFYYDNYNSDSWYFTVFITLLLFVGCLVFTAAFTLYERKLIGLFQRREGPDKVGLEGIGQPFADGLKLVAKETLVPRQTPAPAIFYVAPIISLSISLIVWALVPLSSVGAVVNSNISALLALGISSVGSYGVIYAGWASNNKYALLGSLRAVSQFISYEVILSLLFLPAISITQSINFNNIVNFQHSYGWFSYQLPLIVIFSIVMLAETNRTPFDLPEAEAELVSGFNVEYSSLLFSLFFLAEYCSIGFISAIFVIFFIGGWSDSPFGTFSPNENNYYKSFFSTSNDNISNTPFDTLFSRYEKLVKWQGDSAALLKKIREIVDYKHKKKNLDDMEIDYCNLRKLFSVGVKNAATGEGSTWKPEMAEKWRQVCKRAGFGDFCSLPSQPSSKKRALLKQEILKQLESAKQKIFNGEYFSISKSKKPNIYYAYDNLGYPPFTSQKFSSTGFTDFKVFQHYSNTHYFGHAFNENLKTIGLCNTYYWNFFELSIFQNISFSLSLFIFIVKVIIVSTFFVFVRAALPRKRFDQLISLCWKYLFPISLTTVIWSIAFYIISLTWGLFSLVAVQKNVLTGDAYTAYITGTANVLRDEIRLYYSKWAKKILDESLPIEYIQQLISSTYGVNINNSTLKDTLSVVADMFSQQYFLYQMKHLVNYHAAIQLITEVWIPGTKLPLKEEWPKGVKEPLYYLFDDWDTYFYDTYQEKVQEIAEALCELEPDSDEFEIAKHRWKEAIDERLQNNDHLNINAPTWRLNSTYTTHLTRCIYGPLKLSNTRTCTTNKNTSKNKI